MEKEKGGKAMLIFIVFFLIGLLAGYAIGCKVAKRKKIVIEDSYNLTEVQK